MQREIKFRGQRVDNSEWVFGYFVKAWDNSCYIITEFGSDVTCCSDCGANIITTHEVIPETIGQYTGLHDKNGKEIYEGDIVTGLFNHTDITGHIVYGSDATFFIKRKGLYGIGLNNAEDWLEVIGNIYENQELL